MGVRFCRGRQPVRGDETWSAETLNCEFNEGLMLHSNRITSPHFYSGDFSVTVEFDLHTSPVDLAYFEFWIGTDIRIYNSIWFSGINIYNAGSPSSTLGLFYDSTSSDVHNPYSAPAAYLVDEEGDNVMMIEKTGISYGSI